MIKEKQLGTPGVIYPLGVYFHSECKYCGKIWLLQETPEICECILFLELNLNFNYQIEK